MAYDEGLAEILRGDLADLPGIAEKKMFGGMAFMLNGNMLCGVHQAGGMFRVGKANEVADCTMVYAPHVPARTAPQRVRPPATSVRLSASRVRVPARVWSARANAPWWHKP